MPRATRPDPPPDDGVHPWAEVRNPHPEDTYLRGCGLAIAYRPRRGEPVWRRLDGTLLNHGAALEALSWDEVQMTIRNRTTKGK